MKNEASITTAEPQGKRPYQKPVVRTYGTVGQITMNVGGMGMPDGAGPSNKNMSLP